jgi:hypothetical protein
MGAYYTPNFRSRIVSGASVSMKSGAVLSGGAWPNWFEVGTRSHVGKRQQSAAASSRRPDRGNFEKNAWHRHVWLPPVALTSSVVGLEIAVHVGLNTAGLNGETLAPWEASPCTYTIEDDAAKRKMCHAFEGGVPAVIQLNALT